MASYSMNTGLVSGVKAIVPEHVPERVLIPAKVIANNAVLADPIDKMSKD